MSTYVDQNGWCDYEIVLDYTENEEISAEEESKRYNSNMDKVMEALKENLEKELISAFKGNGLTVKNVKYEKSAYCTLDINFDVINEDCYVEPGESQTWDYPGSPAYIESLYEPTEFIGIADANMSNVMTTILKGIENCEIKRCETIELYDYSLEEEETIFERVEQEEHDAYESYMADRGDAEREEMLMSDYDDRY